MARFAAIIITTALIIAGANAVASKAKQTMAEYKANIDGQVAMAR